MTNVNQKKATEIPPHNGDCWVSDLFISVAELKHDLQTKPKGFRAVQAYLQRHSREPQRRQAH